jgi:hypothetical protein
VESVAIGTYIYICPATCYHEPTGEKVDGFCRKWLSTDMAVNPMTFWYKGELGFFDNYVIPLAKKLKECNVFGVSSDECLNYALQNRAEWEERGEQVIQEMVEQMVQSRRNPPSRCARR